MRPVQIDANAAYWTGAWLNMLVLLACAFAGVREARRQAIDRHRRRMWIAVALVGLFIGSYLVKLALLGRENLALWESSFVYVLRVHELCVLTMILAGATSLSIALRLHFERPLAGRSDLSPSALARSVRLHRRAGWIALLSGTLGVLTAGYVLFGFYQRLGEI